MSLPSFSTQQSLFGVGTLAERLLEPTNRYRLFAETIWPRLAAGRPQLEGIYCADDGRPAVEPVVLLGVSLLQFLDRVPDRAAMELLQMRPHETVWPTEVPLLIVHGDRDKFVPHQDAVDYCARNKGAAFKTIAGADHGFGGQITEVYDDTRKWLSGSR